MKVRAVRRLLGILAAILACAPLEGETKEGFGMIKLAVTLARMRPPDVILTGTRIAVRSWSVQSESPNDWQMIVALENQLLANNPDLQLVTEDPQTLIELSVRDNTVEKGWDDHVKKPIIIHFYCVIYRIRDISTGARLDQDTVVWDWSDSYSSDRDAPGRVQLEAAASTWVAAKIARRVTPTTELVGALLPKGSLKDLGKDIRSGGLWDRYLEALLSLPVRPSPQDESYRQYALGVAYEALAYASEEPETTIRELGKAAEYYQAAIAAHPEEALFSGTHYSPSHSNSLNQETVAKEASYREALAPLERVRTGKAQYQKIIDFQTAREQRLTSSDSTVQEVGIEPRPASSDSAGAEGLTNGVIIRMMRAGLSEEIILTAIETAATTDFDVSLQALLELSEASVSNRVIERMQVVTASQEDR